MSKEYELEKIYRIIVEKAPAGSNPRYDILAEKEYEMKKSVVNEIQKYNPEFGASDYENKILVKIREVINEYALDAFAKGIEFERNLHNQSGSHIKTEHNFKKWFCWKVYIVNFCQNLGWQFEFVWYNINQFGESRK